MPQDSNNKIKDNKSQHLEAIFLGGMQQTAIVSNYSALQEGDNDPVIP